MGLKSLRVKTGRFNRLGLMERRLFREALLLHLRVWLILRFIPFRKIPELFADSGVSANENDIGLLEQIRKAVRRASGILPFKNKCLVSSLAARCMLRRRGIESTVYLGVNIEDMGEILAHAWINSDQFEVVERSGNYNILYSF